MKCRNVYVNKYLRDYYIIKETFNKKIKEREIEYYNDPKICKSCNKTIPFIDRKKTFCNHSCSATFNNKNNKGIKHKISIQGLQNIINHNKSIEHREKVSYSLKKYYKNDDTLIISKTDYNNNPFKCIICLSNIVYEKRKNKTCSKECYKKLCSKNASNNPNCGGETNFKKFIYNEIMFDSSWELEIAKLMDKLNIKWIRSRKIVLYWIDENNNKRRYYPDFYLPDYDLYLDPKNKFKQKLDQLKLEKVKKK